MVLIADLLIGLLFAAHKNPAIAAGQTLYFMLDSERATDLHSAGTNSNHGTSWLRQVADSCQEHSKGREAVDGWVGAALVPEQSSLLDACVREALRLSAHTLGAIRKVAKPEGYTFTSETSDGKQVRYRAKCGEYMAISHLLPHLNSGTWDDPRRYEPRRFLENRAGKEVQGGSEANDGPDAQAFGPYVFTTFSHGIHVCPGRKIAMTMIKLMVAICAAESGPLNHTRAGLLGKKAEIDFSRATLAQRSGKVRVRYEWT